MPAPPTSRRRWTAAPLALSLALTTPALAAPPDYGLDFVTVGDPGNRAATEAEAPWLYDSNFYPIESPGTVDYEFRMMRNEVTNAQWVEFLTAYAPFAQEPIPPTSLTGRTSDGTYQYVPGTGNYAMINTDFRTAARFCNWLHNGKANEAWAFETGAYDTSLFVNDDFGRPIDTNARLPGARYWIPSVHEWTKAMHYDPNKHGPGEPGYWKYPHSSDQPTTPDESDVHYRWTEGDDFTRQFSTPVGLFPDSQSPWGLLGGSGGAAEWLDTVLDGTPGWRLTKESKFGETFSITTYDRIDWISAAGSTHPVIGLRIASVVPAPGTGFVLIACAMSSIIRRRTR